MATAIILRGIPGSGKSTLAKTLASKENICSADDWFVNKTTGVYEFKPHELPQAHAACLKKFIGLLHKYDQENSVDYRAANVVVDNTNLRLTEFKPYQQVAELAGWDVQFHEFIPPHDETFGDYVRLCASRNAHSVSPNQCLRMASIYERRDAA